jgi:hypothetical protein
VVAGTGRYFPDLKKQQNPVQASKMRDAVSIFSMILRHQADGMFLFRFL